MCRVRFGLGLLWMEAVAFQLEGVRGGGWTLGEVGDVSTRARHRSLCERAPALADDRLDLVRGGARVLALDLVRVQGSGSGSG